MEAQSEAFPVVMKEYSPDVLIMDVEGAEDELLRIEDFGSVRHILVELHPHIIGEGKVQELKDLLKQKGFQQGESDRKTFHFFR
ncbi:hypothetical protein D3C86_2088630 [compost metagenome]